MIYEPLCDEWMGCWEVTMSPAQTAAKFLKTTTGGFQLGGTHNHAGEKLALSAFSAPPNRVHACGFVNGAVGALTCYGRGPVDWWPGDKEGDA